MSCGSGATAARASLSRAPQRRCSPREKPRACAGARSDGAPCARDRASGEVEASCPAPAFEKAPSTDPWGWKRALGAQQHQPARRKSPAVVASSVRARQARSSILRFADRCARKLRRPPHAALRACAWRRNRGRSGWKRSARLRRAAATASTTPVEGGTSASRALRAARAGCARRSAPNTENAPRPADFRG